MINNRKLLNWLDSFTLGAPTAPGCYVCAIKLKHFVELKFWDVEDLNANSAKMYGHAPGLTSYVDQDGATIYKTSRITKLLPIVTSAIFRAVPWRTSNNESYRLA